MLLVRTTNVLRDHVVKWAWAYAGMYARVTLCVLWLVGPSTARRSTCVLWLSCWDPRVCLMPRMASGQSANSCWCVVCVVVVTSRGVFVAVLVRCSGDVVDYMYPSTPPLRPRLILASDDPL